MSLRFVHTGIWAGALALAFAFVPMSASAQDSAPASEEGQPAGEDGTMRFAFQGAPWRSVLTWVAEGAGLALYVSETPTGSFTYSDPNAFTPEQAIDRINLFLLPEGFTFVRSGNLLSLISLSDPKSVKQLDALAELVTTDQLEDHGNYDVVKCIFPIGSADPESVITELGGLGLMREPVVLPSSNQLLVTDTANKLRVVKAVLEKLAGPGGGDQLVKTFELQNIDVEELLLSTRTHLGLEPDEMSNIDISISADVGGRKLLVTGSEEQINLLDALIEIVDVASDEAVVESNEETVLRSHDVSGGDLLTVYDVLQTLLIGESIRLSAETKTNSIVALAPASIHERIEATIRELEGPAKEFAVIELQTLSPYFAITLLNELFDIPGIYDEVDEDDEDAPDTPKIDADPENRRLFVRGTKAQIDQVRRVIESMDSQSENLSTTRVLPLFGEHSHEILESAKLFWRDKNPVLILPPATAPQSDVLERTTNPEPPGPQPSTPQRTGPQPQQAQPPSNSRPQASRSSEQWLPVSDRASRSTSTLEWNGSIAERQVSQLSSNQSVSDAPPITVRLTPRGLVIQSDDPEALDRFAEHLQLIGGRDGGVSNRPVVFYLKYARVDDAIRMLAELLDGATSLGNSTHGSLVSGTVSDPDGFLLGSLVLDQDGTTTMTTGSATAVADPRLNRIIVQGTATEIAMIERFLRVIDKQSSITSVETFGRSQIIELYHSRAEDVAAVIRDAYAGRIANAPSNANSGIQRGNQQQQQQQQQQREGGDSNQNREQPQNQRQGERQQGERGGARPGQRGQQSGRQAEMTLAVHEPSNSLIVTAPDHLFREVEQLVRLIDARAEESVEVVAPPFPLSGEFLYGALRLTVPSQESAQQGESRQAAERPQPARSPRPQAPAPRASEARGSQ